MTMAAANVYHFKPLNVGRWLLWSLFALVLLVAPLLWTSSLAQTMLSQMGIAIIACLAYNILLGQGGMLSFGHAVYSGLGSFLAIHALNMVTAGKLPIPVSLIPLVGGAAGLFFAALLGYVTTKKSGTTFAMITLGIGELVWSMSLMVPEFFGGEGGITGNRVVGKPLLGVTFGPQIQLYYLIAVYCFIATAAMFALTRTPLGRMLNAVRDNPERVEFIGYNTQPRALSGVHDFGLLRRHRGWPGGAELRDRDRRSGGRRAFGRLPAVHLPGRRHLLLRPHHRRDADDRGAGAAVRTGPRPGCCTWAWCSCSW